MICPQCNSKILIGNINPEYKKCPHCGSEFVYPLGLEFEDLNEFLVVLLEETNNEIAKESDVLKDYLDEYSEKSVNYKNAIDILIEKECFKYIYDVRKNNITETPEEFADSNGIEDAYVRRLLHFLALVEDEESFSVGKKASPISDTDYTVQECCKLYKANIRENRIDEALKFLEIAMDKGVIAAKFEHGLHLLDIQGRKQEGIKELKECALAGYERAIQRLRYMYLVGYKVEQDIDEAEKYEKMIG